MSESLSNSWLRLEAGKTDGGVSVTFVETQGGFLLADRPYEFEAVTGHPDGELISKGLRGAAVGMDGGALWIRGTLAGLELEMRFECSVDRPFVEERIVLVNPGPASVSLRDLRCGMVKHFSSHSGHVPRELAPDRWIAVPFRSQPGTAPEQESRDFTFEMLMRTPGRIPAMDEEHPSGYVLSDRWPSEGWAWIHGGSALGVFKINQRNLEYSAISPFMESDGASLCFGGVSSVAGHPQALLDIGPGERIELGVTRYHLVKGGYREAAYAFREMLDEHGCRYPEDYDPPVHWNELYDTDDWNTGTPGKPAGIRKTRQVTYTREVMFREAGKAREYSCEALYLDPGWDTHFGELRWGDDWLGERKSFIDELRRRYDLGVSIECVFATWLSLDGHGGNGVASYPREALRMNGKGEIVEGRLCMGSRQYLDDAVERILPHFRDGVGFIMIDGNWYPGECHDPDHGHPVPYTIEDHWNANMELVTRIHRAFPDVLVELHDPVTWALQRYSPVYFRHGLPYSWNENWAIEMMWHPLDDIRSGKAACLYYYNLACNIPLYVHVDLRTDTMHCLVLWWFASTCRHFGIGGTHSNPNIVLAQKDAMKRYRELSRFYKRGEFYGYGEEIHVHLLREEGAFTVNLFNLSGTTARKEAVIDMADLGLDPDCWYTVGAHGNWYDSERHALVVDRTLEPWAAEVFEIHRVPSGRSA